MQASVSFPKKPAQGGYTLVELAIAVAILAVLIVAGLSGVQNIMTSSKVNDQIKTVARLSSKVSATFATTSTSGITTANMAGLGGWDTSKVSSNGAVTSSFATSEFVATNPAAITDLPLNAGLIYTISKVPTGACADLATGISNVIYALKIQSAAATAAAQTSWLATSAIEVKAPGAAINNISLATACALSTSSVDFIIALKP